LVSCGQVRHLAASSFHCCCSSFSVAMASATRYAYGQAYSSQFFYPSQSLSNHGCLSRQLLGVELLSLSSRTRPFGFCSLETSCRAWGSLYRPSTFLHTPRHWDSAAQSPPSLSFSSMSPLSSDPLVWEASSIAHTSPPPSSSPPSVP